MGKKIYIFLIIVGFILVIAAGIFYFLASKQTNSVVCTQEVKICPDGSAVGRVGPNCEFMQCPAAKNNSAETASQQNKVTQSNKTTNNMQNFQIKSTAFVNNGRIPAKYTCDGEGINPELSISGIPANAKSLAIILDDPDAPGGTFNHWVVWNIPPTVSTIKEGGLVEGVAGINSGGDNGYFGPCPPSGTHRYIFKLYALDTLISLNSNAGSYDLKSAINGHVLNQTQLTGLYR